MTNDAGYAGMTSPAASMTNESVCHLSFVIEARGAEVIR
jgi:hypothetical protein